MSVVNWVEVLSKLAERGEDPELAAVEMEEAGLIGGVVSMEMLTAEDAVQIARLRPLTRSRGLSLADRACLVLARRLGVSVVTADGTWAGIPNLGIDITLIRGR